MSNLSDRTCSVPGCTAKHSAKGYCHRHYMRMRNNGSLEVAERAESFSEKYTIDQDTECWIWARATDKDGYGKHKFKGREIRAHRFSWEAANGPIPHGKILCHKCDNPPCVNPRHMFLGSHAMNHADRNSKGRTASGERHGNYKFSDEVVRVIRDSRPGEKEAFRLFEVRRSQYYRIIRGEVRNTANV